MEELDLKKLVELSKVDEAKQIGNLSEKTLHKVVKMYLESDNSFHEIKIGNYYADIYKDGLITEIQTKHFNKLRDKLDYFLKEHSVLVVFPSFRKKWINWIDKTSLEVVEKRLSPKTGTVYQIFHELYKIKFHLKQPGLKFKIILFDMDEFRLLNGYSENKKRGSVKHNSIPLELVEVVDITSQADFKKLIPSNLPSEFTTKDFSKYSKLTLSKSQTAVNVLAYLNVIERIGNVGRSYLYRVV